MKKTLKYLINLSFILYFLILLTERTISVVLSFVNGINITNDLFNSYTYLLVFASLGAWLLYTLLRCLNSFKALFKSDVEIPFKDLCIASGIILLSGMVHTEYTISIIQFVAYGILIVGILLRVILIKTKNIALKWLSFAYLVAFSMAIPVMYHSNIDLHVLFHIIEAVASFALVILFTNLLLMLFSDKDDLFMLIPISAAVLLDISLIILRWNEEINWFVLIFISLSFILFVIGYIFKKLIKNKEE